MNNDTLGSMFVHSSPKERQFKEGNVKDGLECLKGGRRRQYTHAKAGESNICAVGGNILLEGACVLNRIRKLKERKHKQADVRPKLERCRDLLL